MEWPDSLSPHFSTASLVRSSRASAMGIDNTPPDDLIGNAQRLVAMAEQARAVLGKAAGREIPMVVTSGFRCLALNRAVGGSGSHPGETISAHCYFRAMDFIPTGMGVADAFEALRGSELDFDKLIFEIDHEGDTWIHLQVAREGATPARRVFRGVKTPVGSTYQELPRA